MSGLLLCSTGIFRAVPSGGTSCMSGPHLTCYTGIFRDVPGGGVMHECVLHVIPRYSGLYLGGGASCMCESLLTCYRRLPIPVYFKLIVLLFTTS